jgi:hypothetical protein
VGTPQGREALERNQREGITATEALVAAGTVEA